MYIAIYLNWLYASCKPIARLITLASYLIYLFVMLVTTILKYACKPKDIKDYYLFHLQVSLNTEDNTNSASVSVSTHRSFYSIPKANYSTLTSNETATKSNPTSTSATDGSTFATNDSTTETDNSMPATNTPATDDSTPTTNDSTTATNDSTSTNDDFMPTTNDSMPTTDDSTLATNDFTPATDHFMPMTNNSKPATDHSKPATNDSKSATNDSKPAAEHSKPAAEHSKPATEDSTSLTDDYISASDDSVNDDSTLDSQPFKNSPVSKIDMFLNLLDMLGLTNKYPQKINIADARLICEELLGNIVSTNNLHALPYLILQKIIMHDYQRLPLYEDLSSTEFSCSIDTGTNGIHPIDNFLAIFHCCDNFLRQNLLYHLSVSQLAVPFLLPDPTNTSVTLLLWALYSIVRKWKSTTGINIVIKESRIIDHSGPLISFLRIGRSQECKSKSKILNTVIGEHDYFFHWNCEGGSSERKFVDGLVELCYYLPSGKHNDHFSDSVFFLNLRGDARNYHEQVSFMNKISFMCFVLLLENNLSKTINEMLKNLANSPGGLVVIFPDYDETTKLKTFCHLSEIIQADNVVILNIKRKNDADVKNVIRKIISQKISASKTKKFTTIAESAAIATKVGISVDTESKECIDAKRLAEDTMKKVDFSNPTEAKTQMLPLQGDKLWHTWADLDKKSLQTTFKKNHLQTIERRKHEIRKKQLEYLTLTSGLNPVMKNFVDGLTHKSPTFRNYFWQWLKIFLDDHSRKILPGMHTKYEKTKFELKRLKKEGLSETAKQYKAQVNLLQRQSIDLIEGSLGLEHFFRELGQLYEAGQISEKSQQLVSQYPRIAVEMLNSGYPLELMDGDASHVPLTWISAVLCELQRFHKGKKVFVISILGIQSTGKSTLLNTMFGIQFNVSAGRCTRGAYLQLLPVSSQSSKGMCDYLLIVDTEGLRAPELALEQSNKHDNELATFVIGIADVTLINIFGEAPGDLNDILQTAVHAFIRMKEVDMNLSCHFVHQNVTALDDKKLSIGKENFLDNLNKMTLAAAKAENFEGRYHSFQDVIQFDEAKNVSYFPGLWKGDPPMAQINPSYSHKAQILKQTLIKLTKTHKGDSIFSIFESRVQRLWLAVCRENYIFSFKNTLEVTAYNELDAKFSEWSWTIHRKMKVWQIETANIINNTSPNKNLSQLETECLKKVKGILITTSDEVAKAMNSFFDTSDRCETLAQWRGRYELRLDHLKEDSIREAKKHCTLLKAAKQNQLIIEDVKRNHRQQLLNHITTLVKKSKHSKESLTQKELRAKFDEKWEEWMKKICESIDHNQRYATDQEIESNISDILEDLCKKDGYVLVSKLSINLKHWGEHNRFSFEIDPEKHLSCRLELSEPVSTSLLQKVTGLFRPGTGSSKKHEPGLQHAKRKHEEFLIIAKEKFREKQKHFVNFDQSFVYDLLSEFIKIVEDQNHKSEKMFTGEYIADMALRFAGYVTLQITHLMKEVRAKNDPIASFNKLKSTYFNTFIDQYKEISGERAAAGSLCSLLSVAVESAVVEILPDDIVDKMKSSDAAFKTKNLFKVKILKDLARKNDFELYTVYLSDIRSCFEWWAAQYVTEFCKENNSLFQIAKPIVHGIITKIIDSAAILQTDISMQLWLAQFHNVLSKTIVFNLNEMQDIIEANPNHSKISSNFFVEELTEALKKEEEALLERIADPTSKFSAITKWTKSPHILLADSLVGCKEQCPFCGEQCEITDKNHLTAEKDHHIDIHRPQCLRKYTWEESNELVFDTCSESIDSQARFRNKDTDHKFVPYKDYRTIYDKWTISNDKPSITPKYWQWFVYNHIDDLITWAGAAPSSKKDHPDWSHISKNEAIKSLSEIYNVT